MNLDSLWNEILTAISNEMTTLTFNTWFKDTTLLSLNDNKAMIKVVTPIYKKILNDKYYDLIDSLFVSIEGKSYDLIFVCDDDLENNEDESIIETNTEEVFESKVDKKYLFSNFVVGDSNKFAYVSAQSVAANPGTLYNPFFLYGKSGLGKTHLMHAIGNYIEENSNKRVLYVTCDEFLNDYTGLSNPGNVNNFDYMQKFKAKYRDIDVLMIDDIQFLSGAEKTQKEFFHTFDNLWKSNKQIIISSDTNPDDLKSLEERLKTRFAWGLTANIEPPDFTLKCNLIKNKINRHDVAKLIDEEVIEFLANSCENDVRHIEGTVTRLYAYAAMTGTTKININFAQEALKDYLKKSVYLTNNITKIMDAVAKYYNITIEDLKSKKRTNNIAYPRQIGMYLCRMTTDESSDRIGLEFGGRDHATVLFAEKKILKDLSTNNQLQNIINNIKDRII